MTRQESIDATHAHLDAAARACGVRWYSEHGMCGGQFREEIAELETRLVTVFELNATKIKTVLTTRTLPQPRISVFIVHPIFGRFDLGQASSDPRAGGIRNIGRNGQKHPIVTAFCNAFEGRG